MREQENTGDYIIRFQTQPDFPNEDLTEDNALNLKYFLAREPGVDEYASYIEKNNNFVYDAAHRALQSLGIKTSPNPTSRRAFSHGFASFEVMTDLMHEDDQRAYPFAVAAERVANDLIDARSESDRKVQGYSEEEMLPPNMETDGIRPRYYVTGQGDHLDLPQELANFLVERHAEKIQTPGNERAHATINIANHYKEVMTSFPNVVDVTTEIGLARAESMPILYSRLAGMAIAHSLQYKN